MLQATQLSITKASSDKNSQISAKKGFPKAILSAVREEFYGQDPEHPVLEMTVRNGRTGEIATLPIDLKGHVFIIGPVGSVASYKIPNSNPQTILPTHDGWTPLLNGDGMVYRLDFHTTPVTPHQTDSGTTCTKKQELGKAWLTTRLIKPPSYYADRITYLRLLDENKKQSSSLKFWSLGIFRISSKLGLCKQLNTSFLPIKFLNEARERLLVTNDASRPFEIDPCSLKTLAPVGLNKDWKPLLRLDELLRTPFRAFMSSAHPCFDFKTGEMFITNVQQSARTALQASLISSYQEKQNFWKHFPITAIVSLRENWQNARWSNLQAVSTKLFCTSHSKTKNSLNSSPQTAFPKTQFPITRILSRLIKNFVIQSSEILLKSFDSSGASGDDSLYLMNWSGDKQIRKWKVVLSNGSLARIQQSTHTLGVTQNHIILADTAFKISLANVLPNELVQPLIQWFIRIKQQLDLELKDKNSDSIESHFNKIRFHLTCPQSPDTYFYIIARNQLKASEAEGFVKAQRVRVEGEITHFLADYDETPDGQIILHAAMNYATDAAQYIHKVDNSINANLQKELQQLSGMWTAGMDVNGPAVIVINPKKSEAKKYDLNLGEALRYTLFLGLFTYRDDMPTQQFEDIYLMGGGGWETMLTELIHELYADYRYRRVSVSEIERILKEGVPSILSRVHIDHQILREAIQSGEEPDRPILTIQDAYDFPEGFFANSPQFVPREGSQGSTNGYIVCNVVHSDNPLSNQSVDLQEANCSSQDSNWSNNSELWIFDASNLRQGPLYKLSHPYLNFSLTLHTTWMRDIMPASANTYDVEEDFKDLVTQAVISHPKPIGEQIQQLFTEVYKQFKSN